MHKSRRIRVFEEAGFFSANDIISEKESYEKNTCTEFHGKNTGYPVP